MVPFTGSARAEPTLEVGGGGGQSPVWPPPGSARGGVAM
jgi:hypothetical protein